MKPGVNFAPCLYVSSYVLIINEWDKGRTHHSSDGTARETAGYGAHVFPLLLRGFILIVEM
jgi:hypothetical protein